MLRLCPSVSELPPKRQRDIDLARIGGQKWNIGQGVRGMHMEVTSRSSDKAIVIYVDGDLTTTSSPKVESEINEILEETTNNVVINVEHVNFIASTGLRIILALGKRLNSKGLKLTVCSMNATTKSVFDMSGFTKLFPIFETEAEALENM
jgi:anti-sigma B factor antagonist